MTPTYHRVTEGEFVRHLKSNTIDKVIVQESVEQPTKFVVVAINKSTETVYAMRHGRVNELRVWRLDNLAKFLRKHSVTSFDVKFQK